MKKENLTGLSELLCVQSTTETFGMTKWHSMGWTHQIEVLILAPLKSMVILSLNSARAELGSKCHDVSWLD